MLLDLVCQPHGAGHSRRVDSREHPRHAARGAAADVEAFPENKDGEKAKTIRAIMEQHRAKPTCNACHGVMDPLGFAFENFDAIGEWRSRTAGRGFRSTRRAN